METGDSNGSSKKKKIQLGFIDGTLFPPAVSSNDFPQWMHYNNMVKSWLLNSISKDLVS
jgi:hypothetical protein